MTHYPRSATSRRECPPDVDPADQPYSPGCNCDPLPETVPPKDPDEPEVCPTDTCCKCPTMPATTPECLERLIDLQTTEIAAAEQATELKKDLTQLLDDTTAGNVKYTREEYDSLIEQWVKLDFEIAGLLQTLECKLKCWRCVVECYICPLLHQSHYAKKWLYDDGQSYDHVYDLYDLQYWHTKDLTAKERRYERINEVVKVWLDPVATIDAVLRNNRDLYTESINLVGKDPQKTIYDVFFKLVPRHLAIAPPRGSEWETRIDKRFTKFCECEPGAPDTCCGPDTGELAVRHHLTGPQPYLIDPGEYFKLICCLVEKRWTPARLARDKAKLKVAEVKARIDRYLGKITGDWRKNFEVAARAAIPSDIECCDFEPDHHGAQQQQARQAHP